MKESERREACLGFNEIESVLADETLKSFGTPDSWENLSLLKELTSFTKDFCEE